MMRRKIYDRLVKWKQEKVGTTALLNTEGSGTMCNLS